MGVLNLKLKRLSANMSTFHEVVFNDGLTFIVGQRENPNISDVKATYNGIGKSLIVTIIHFCLGSKKIESFERELSDWVFKLEFTIDSDTYVAERACNNQEKIKLNSKEMSIKNFNKEMGEKIFNISEDDKGLSFRALIKHFIRTKSGYEAYDRANARKEYDKLLCQCHLLGLDTKKVRDKHEIMQNISSVRGFINKLKNEPVVKNAKRNNVTIAAADLEEAINKLEKSLDDFQIASDYHAVVSEADEISKQISKQENDLFLIQDQMKLIEDSLVLQPDITSKRLFELYKEANIALPEKVINTVNDVELFHNTLLKNRAAFLSKQYAQLQEQQKQIKLDIHKLFDSKNNLLKYLDCHGALDEYTAISKKLIDDKEQLSKMTEIVSLIERYEISLANSIIELQQSHIETNQYLATIKPFLNEIMSTFRSFSRHFYGDTPGGINIKNNTGENSMRYDIKAEIQSDSSDGISEVKIFCYDMTLLLLAQNHHVEFIFHDSRLFGNMDPRQKIQLIKAVDLYTKDHNIQYIASINEDMVNSIQPFLKDQNEFESINKTIIDNTKLTLTDKDDSSKLLGVQVNLGNLE